MKLYIYIESSELADIASDTSKSIQSWITESASQAVLINSRAEQEDALEDTDFEDWHIGLNLDISKGRELKEPLNFLYKLAKKYKCDFVLGIFSGEQNNPEDICYFGFEEGKPDYCEISSYIGVKI